MGAKWDHAQRPYFIAKDSHNHLVSTLTHESVIISDNKTAVTDFDLVHATDLPLEVGVLIDTSGSQRSTSLPEAWKAAKDFVNNIARAGDDRAFFLTFSDKAEATPWLTKGDLAGRNFSDMMAQFQGQQPPKRDWVELVRCLAKPGREKAVAIIGGGQRP